MSRLLCGSVCVYGQRNGKPLAPMTHIPDVQAMPLGVIYQPALLGLERAVHSRRFTSPSRRRSSAETALAVR